VDDSRTEPVLAATGQELPKEPPGVQGQAREAGLQQSAGSTQERLSSFCLCADKGRLLPVCLGQQKPWSQPQEKSCQGQRGESSLLALSYAVAKTE